MNYNLLGIRIRQERKRLNLTQEQLAETIDVSHAYIGQIERAERSVTLDTLIRITKQLGVSVDELLHDSIEYTESHYIDRIKKIMNNRDINEQKMVFEMLELMFFHIDQKSPSEK